MDLVIEQELTVETVRRTVIIARGGRRTAVELQAALTRSPDASVLGLAMVFRDVTLIARAEADSMRLAAIVESSNDAIIGQTLDGRITSWNAAAQRMFGYGEKDALGQPVQMLIPPGREAEEAKMLLELATGRPHPPFDTVRLTRGGGRLDVSVMISPVRDGHGHLVAASSIARDVSLQRRAEAALRASDERLRFTLEAAQIGDWDLDLVNGTARHSLRHDQCFGYDQLQSEWTFDKFSEHVHTEDRAEVTRSFRVAVTELSGWRIQCRVLWPDKSIHWISAHGRVMSEGDQASHMLGIVSDITEQRQAEEARLKTLELEAENRQMHEASRIKSQFLANMSHELRTPLNAVIGFADLLHSGAVSPESPKHQEFLGHIGASGRHLLQLINDVLDLAKVESGKFDFFPEPIDVTALLKEVNDVLHTEVQRKGVQIGTRVDPRLAGLTLDPARLKQVLYNYLSNAIKFSHRDGFIDMRVLAKGPDHVRIEVEDRGVGISTADQQRLFSEFQQLDSGYGKRHEGTGLGLALTRRLVEAQGGSVGVRSTAGVGSVFHVVLPQVHRSDAQRAEAASTGVPVALHERLLVIEDDERDRDRLVTVFCEAGFEVDAALDRIQALQRARDTYYSALTLDLGLTGQGGLDLLGNIRSHGASRASPVIAVTVPVGSDSAAAAFAVANVLSKPLQGDEVREAMSRFGLPKGGRAQVMVIDDDPAALELMQSVLESMGIDAVCFRDGRVALQRIDTHSPDAIILDLMMPEFDGFQILAELQQSADWRDVPVFIWTSMMLTDEEYARLSQSAQAVLSKGGGAMDDMMSSILRWRRPLPAAQVQ